MTKDPTERQFKSIETELDLNTLEPVKQPDANGEIEIEIVDDTPEADRGKARAEPLVEPPAGVIPTDDELKTYSDSVQKRFKKITYEFHEQRRAREAAERQIEEAARIARQLYEENQRIKSRMQDGEKILIEQAKGKVEAQIESARDKYRKAHESGDTEALVKANEEMSALQAQKLQVSSYQPQYQEPARQQPQQTQAPKPAPADPKAEAWASKNTWFQKNSAMTGFAFGVHEELVNEQGIDPRREPDAYYQALDRRMREAFPTHEWPDKPSPVRQPPSVVAPATRASSGISSDGRKITLTPTQIVIAKRLGLTPKQYATEVLRMAQEQ